MTKVRRHSSTIEGEAKVSLSPHLQYFNEVKVGLTWVVAELNEVLKKQKRFDGSGTSNTKLDKFHRPSDH